MGHHPLVSGAALSAVLLFACSLTHPAEMTSAIRSVTPHALTGKDQAAPRLLAPRSACPAITPAVIAAGRRIFAGPGNCHACHGADAGGTPMAPTLHAHRWLNIDGSYASIVGLVQRGVPKPKSHPEAMPAMGGANLSASQVCDVAADVYSLSHPTAAPRTAARVKPSPAPRAVAHAAPKPVGRPAPRQVAPAAVSAPAAVPAAQAITATGASDTTTVSMRAGKMQITFSGAPENYTIRVDNPDGRTSSTYAYSAGGAPGLVGQVTARPADAAAAAPAAAAPQPVVAPTAATPSAPTATPAAGCASMEPALIAAGRKVFSGPGNCYACHGGDAKGTPMAPSLGAHAWLNIDGSYASIAGLVASGVPAPKAHPAPMPPKGGAQLSGQQVCAVAAYVYSLSH